MNPATESKLFRRVLAGWAMRGVLCAAASAYWAILAGFTSITDIAGMVAGVGFWVVVFALFSHRLLLNESEASRLVKALNIAAWVKFFATIVILPAILALFGGFGFPGLFDMFLGLASLKIVCWIGGFPAPESVARLDSLGWTTLTTVVDGALTAIVIGIIALTILGCWRIWFGPERKHKLSPALTVG